MNKGRLLNFAVVAVVIGTLVFLIMKTRNVDIEGYRQITDNLRQLKQADSDWTAEVLKARIGTTLNYDAITAPLAKIEQLGVTLRGQAQQLPVDEMGRQSILRALDSYAKSMNEKVAAVERFKSQSAVLKNSSRYLPEAAAEVVKAARLANMGERELHAVELGVATLVVRAQTYLSMPSLAARAAIDEQIAAMKNTVERLPPDVGNRMEPLIMHAETVLREQVVGAEVLAQVLGLATAKNINSVADAFEDGYRQMFTEQQTLRAYLAVYSIFLLVLLIMAGMKLYGSYQLINERNVALQDANSQLKESQVQLVQSEKMSALGQMVAGIAHEVNTPLAYVRATVDVVCDQLKGVREALVHGHELALSMDARPVDKAAIGQRLIVAAKSCREVVTSGVIDEIDGLLRESVHGVEQIGEIVTNLKNFSRLDRAKVTPFSVQEGLESTLTLMRNSFGSGRIDIVKAYGDTPQILCAPSQINQVFLNIISNAVHALQGREGAALTLRTSQLDGDRVCIEIQDNGTGIPADVLPRIFDPFFTTKDVGEGTGMGLSISYKIIKEHGGEIQVDSEEGIGTVFAIILPQAPPEPRLLETPELSAAV